MVCILFGLPIIGLIIIWNYHLKEWLLANLRELEPELCITAAYGNILSTKFLNIPKQGWDVVFVYCISICLLGIFIRNIMRLFCFNISVGTVNIHPSLLPLYRGAAPVQRALQVKIT